MRSKSIERWKKLIKDNNLKYYLLTDREIRLHGANNTVIQINHNGQYHWTIRIDGTAKDGMRFDFDVDVKINNGFIVINDILAIRLA